MKIFQEEHFPLLELPAASWGEDVGVDARPARLTTGGLLVMVCPAADTVRAVSCFCCPSLGEVSGAMDGRVEVHPVPIPVEVGRDSSTKVGLVLTPVYGGPGLSGAPGAPGSTLGADVPPEGGPSALPTTGVFPAGSMCYSTEASVA